MNNNENPFRGSEAQSSKSLCDLYSEDTYPSETSDDNRKDTKEKSPDSRNTKPQLPKPLISEIHKAGAEMMKLRVARESMYDVAEARRSACGDESPDSSENIAYQKQNEHVTFQLTENQENPDGNSNGDSNRDSHRDSHGDSSGVSEESYIGNDQNEHNESLDSPLKMKYIKRQMERSGNQFEQHIEGMRKTWNSFRNGYVSMVDGMGMSVVDLQTLKEENESLKEALGTNQETIDSQKSENEKLEKIHRETELELRKDITVLKAEKAKIEEQLKGKDEAVAKEMKELREQLKEMKASVRQNPRVNITEFKMKVIQRHLKEQKKENEYLRDTLNTALSQIALSKRNTVILADDIAKERKCSLTLINQVEKCMDLQHQANDFHLMKYGSHRMSHKLNALKSKVQKTRRDSKRWTHKVNATLSELTHPFDATPSISASPEPSADES